MISPRDKHTVDHLKELVNEVAELHPILHALFSKLPGIERVHYNQGSDELGADFILFKKDATLQRTHCIGVVAKVGKIRQDTAEIDRQVGECFILRKALDGQPIQIREVWVVSSQDITKNAREVINHKYADKKIEFIPAQDLARLIDEFAPESFVTISPALQNLAESLTGKLDLEEQNSLVIPGMSSFYVEPKIAKRYFDGYGNARPEKGVKDLNDLLATLLEDPLSIIQAGVGGGKSKLARELTRRILQSSEYADGLLLPSGHHANQFINGADVQLRQAVEQLRLSAKCSGRVIFFIDGFDEIDIDDHQRSEFVSALLQAGIALGASIVLLSRPFDEVSVLGSRVHSINIFKIEPLKGRRAIELLSKIAGQLDGRSRIVADLGKSNLLHALDGAPIAYILLGRLIAENQQDIPSNLTELFQKYSELVLGRWEISKGLRSQQEYEVIVEALIWLAGYMLDNQLVEVARAELEQWIRQYCRDRGIDISASELVDRVTGRTSILYLSRDSGCLGFRHRAFCEFFYARRLHRSSNINLTPDVFAPYWMNSYFFLAGLQRDCPELIQTLSDLELDTEPHKIMRILSFGGILLAGYLTPTAVCVTAIKKMAHDAADLFIAASSPESDSPLTQFPTIQMLCALTGTFTNQYGYRHFRPALEEAIFELEKESLTEGNALALFLLDTAYKDAGGALKFDELIERFGDSLPLVVKLAIQHESDRMKVMSDRVRKMERNMRRTFNANKGSKDFLRLLYKVPVRQLDRKLI